jgi:hypothetical protein
MRISLQTADGTYALAGDAELGEREFSSADGFELSASIRIDVIGKVRGSYAKPLDRGNLRTQVRFGTRRIFDSAADAEAFAADLTEVPREGIVFFDTGAGRRKLLDAVVDPPVVVPEGCRVEMIYRAAGGSIVLVEPEIIIEGGDVESMTLRLVEDDVAMWPEVGFMTPFLIPGNAADGWTDPGGNLAFRIERSEDLVSWDHDLIDAPGSPVDNGDGTYTYWARSLQPRIWKYVTIDVALTSARHAKSITAIKLFGSTITLPNYPYAMPGDASVLQADLLAAGYPGATVSSVPHAMTVEAYDYSDAGRKEMPITLVGADVTDVKDSGGSTIPLPSYPYAMPGAVTALQADLVTAGFLYAGVRVYGDDWTIVIPDRSTIFAQRDFAVSIDPADPYTYEGITGTGTDAGSSVYGSFSNVRATTGLDPLEEAAKQFFRMGISAGPNYQF